MEVIGHENILYSYFWAPALFRLLNSIMMTLKKNTSDNALAQKQKCYNFMDISCTSNFYVTKNMEVREKMKS